MKQIVMLEALCNNERGWAKVMSHSGRVSLVQLEGFRFTEHVEIWQNGRHLESTPPKKSIRWAFLDEMTFGSVLALTTIKRGWRVMMSQRTDVTIGNVNSMAAAALFFRAIGRTRKAVCLVCDYFPPHQKLHVRIYRRISTFITRCLCKWSDEVWYVSPRIPTVQVNPRHFVIPLYINDENVPCLPRQEIGYIGMPSPDHALEILFDICRRHQIRLNLVGDSAYLKSIRHLAPPDTVFHGLVSDPAKIKEIFSRCFCGYAVYRNLGPHNYSYFGIPSKILNYFANNTPVITTNTADFTKHINPSGIGQVVEPQPDQIEKAILDLKARPADYYDAIQRFRKTWNEGVEQFHQERLAALLAEP